MIPMMGATALAAEYRLFQVQFCDERLEPRTDLSYVAVYNAGSLTASTLKAERSGDTAVTNPMTRTTTATGLRPNNGLAQFYSTKTTVDIIAHVGGREVSFRGVKPTDKYFVVPYSTPRYSRSNAKGGYVKFDGTPIQMQPDGTVPADVDTEINLWMFNQGTFEASNINTQTLFTPVWTASGLNVAMDQTDTDGVEINQGILANSPAAFTVGTDGPFYFRCTFTSTDVSGSDDCAIGFRNDGAYAPLIDNYTDMAVLNNISGSIYTETIVGSAATV